MWRNISGSYNVFPSVTRSRNQSLTSTHARTRPVVKALRIMMAYTVVWTAQTVICDVRIGSCIERSQWNNSMDEHVG